MIFFEANLLMAGLIFYLQFSYAASHRDLLAEEISAKMMTEERRNNLIILVISSLAIVLALLGIDGGALLYFLAPFIFILLSRIS